MADRNFTFNISLSVLNHLGRNLYRSFITVLGEAISNSWDADAESVRIYIDRQNHSLVIKDDGIGMNEHDFQNHFLKIGYSKRKEGVSKSEKGRPFIGRKGIGKLAMLSCAKRVTVISKVEDGEYVGGCIDNSGLDAAIKDDLTPDQYELGTWSLEDFKVYTESHTRGTIIRFEGLHDGIRNTVEYLKKMIALNFRFSLNLKDDQFNLYLNNDLISVDHLRDLAGKTSYLWKVNEIEDPYVNEKLTVPPLVRNSKKIEAELNIYGFIASVEKPSNLKISTTNERVSIDLFVNGRLRVKDILKHIPTTRIVESYLYGQIHYDELDDEKDRFTSSREGIVADDPKYRALLEELQKKVIPIVMDDWDKWRLEAKKDGDPDNERFTRKQRGAKTLFSAVTEEYTPSSSSLNKDKVDGWVNGLANDAEFNFASYAECFVSENLIRHYIHDKNISISKEAKDEIQKWQTKELDSKGRGNISIDIRKNSDELSYLSMDHLANLVDKVQDKLKDAGLSRDASEYKPVRDALAHTALLTDSAKIKLTSVYQNIQARLKKLLTEE